MKQEVQQVIKVLIRLVGKIYAMWYCFRLALYDAIPQTFLFLGIKLLHVVVLCFNTIIMVFLRTLFSYM